MKPYLVTLKNAQMKRLATFILTAMAVLSAQGQPFQPRQAQASATADDIITALPATAENKLYILDTDIMSGVHMQHYTWSGRFCYVAFDSNGKDVYFKNLCPEYVFDTYVKGEIDGNTIKIAAGQHVFHQDEALDQGQEEADLYLRAAVYDGENDEMVPSDAEYITFNVADDGTITCPEGQGAAYVDPTGYVLAKNHTYKFEPFDIESTVTLPEGAEIRKYDLQYSPETGGNTITTTAEVAFDGDDVYVKGLASYTGGWIKGKVEKDSVRFASRQFVGRYSNDAEITNDFAVFFNGAYDTGESDVMGRVYATTPDIAFAYDEEKGTLKADRCVTETIGDRNLLSHMVVPALIPSATGGEFLPSKPATPEISDYKDYVFSYRFTVNIPSSDTEGKPLDTDKLVYRFYMDGEPFTFSTSEYNYIDEDITDIPYSYLDYDGLGSDISQGWDNPDERTIVLYREFKTIAVESEYTVDGVTNTSDRYVYDVATKTGTVEPAGDPTGICHASAGAEVVKVTYTDLSGRAVTRPGKGIYIRTCIMSDGSRTSKKVMK